MSTLHEAVQTFLSSKRIAVAGVSRNSSQPANAIYRKLKTAGHGVYAVNPKAQNVEGDPCYADLGSIPGGIEAVVIATKPEIALEIVQQCEQLGIRRIWMHRSFGKGSVSDEAVQFCRQHDMLVIDGACPLMFCQPVDFAHLCMRTILGWVGRMPKIE